MDSCLFLVGPFVLYGVFREPSYAFIDYVYEGMLLVHQYLHVVNLLIFN